MEVPIRNKKIIALLDKIITDFHNTCDECEIDIDNYNYNRIQCNIGKQTSEEIQNYISEKFLREKFLSDPEAHVGYPLQYRVIPVEHLAEYYEGFDNFYKWGKYDLPIEIGAASSALFVHYPHDGLTGWHTNWNANAYQLLFTWSETGDGFFRYYDKAKDEIVTIQDKPGWQCRWYYFGRKDEPEHHCWHACYAGASRRMTLAFKFSNKGKDSEEDTMAQLLRDELVAEISSDE